MGGNFDIQIIATQLTFEDDSFNNQYDEDADSIVSVIEVLETMDEDGVVVSEDAFSEMIASLNSNTEYALL